MSLRCAYCHGPDEGASTCSGCATRVHPECLRSAGRCPTLGCAMTVTGRVEPRPSWTSIARRLAVRLAVVAVLVAVVSPCCWSMGLGRSVHVWWLRRWVDHESLRATCLELQRRHPDGAYLSGSDLPPEIRRLVWSGRSGSADVTRDRVFIDVGSFWIDSYGFEILTDPSAALRSIDELSPGVRWWDAG